MSVTRPPRIAVAGSAVMDLVTFTNQFPRAGETLVGKSFDLGFGGKGANQAAAARLCGAETIMVARVGDDLFGPATIRNFEALGIDASEVRIVPGCSTGVAPIFVEDNGQNRIIVVKAANDHLKPEDIDDAAPRLRQADALVLQLEIPLETVTYALSWARANGVRSILNPAPAQPLEMDAVALADYVIPNETEAEALTGMSVGSEDEARRCARWLLDHGARRVILTLGERGALLASSDGAELVPPHRVVVKDTTGAGDAFIGSFAAFLCEGRSEREAVARANVYAALSTTKAGTQKSFPTRKAFEGVWRDVIV